MPKVTVTVDMPNAIGESGEGLASYVQYVLDYYSRELPWSGMQGAVVTLAYQAPDFDNDKDYREGDEVIFGGNVYRANSDCPAYGRGNLVVKHPCWQVVRAA